MFADVSAFTQPYNDALARQKVIAIGAPYMSREWFRARAPYSWSIVPDCTIIAETIAEYANKRIYGYTADHAGGDLKGKPRKVAIIAPDNPEYQQCVDAGDRMVTAAGNQMARYSYTLDLASLSDQANNLAAKLKSDRITTVVLATDPLIPLLLTNRLSQQDYYPEWVVTGTALTDIDMVGQFYDQSQWRNAFGLSYFAESQPIGASYAYHAFKSVDPDHEPIFGVELLYYFCYMVALGVQGAGPESDARDFAAGMRAYPGGTGPAGTWGFPDGEFTPYRDAREIWWDPDGPSVMNGAAGRYASDGKRHKPGSGYGRRARAAGRERPPRGRTSDDARRPAALGRGAAHAGAVVALAATALLFPGRRTVPLGVVVLGALLGTGTGLLAVGLVLTYRSHRMVNFAYGGMGGLGAGLAVGLHTRTGLAVAGRVRVGLATGLPAGALIERIVLRRLERSPRLVVTVATIGLAQLLRRRAGRPALPARRAGPGRCLRDAAEPSSASPSTRCVISGNDLALVAFVPLVLGGLTWFLLRTDAGVAVRGLAENGDRARLLGIPAHRLSLLVWTLAGGLAAFTVLLRVAVRRD